MTRKDFELIASLLRAVGLDYDTQQYAITAFADALATAYPNFNRSKFLKAAGAYKP
jgi:hypothetical protein